MESRWEEWLSYVIISRERSCCNFDEQSVDDDDDDNNDDEEHFPTCYIN